MTIARDRRRLHRPRDPRVPAAARLVVAAEGRRQDARRRPGRGREAARQGRRARREAVRDLAQGRQPQRRRRAARAASKLPTLSCRDRTARQPGLRVGRGGGGRARCSASAGLEVSRFDLDRVDDAVAARPRADPRRRRRRLGRLRGRGRRRAPGVPLGVVAGRDRQRLRPGARAAGDLAEAAELAVDRHAHDERSTSAGSASARSSTPPAPGCRRSRPARRTG